MSAPLVNRIADGAAVIGLNLQMPLDPDAYAAYAGVRLLTLAAVTSWRQSSPVRTSSSTTHSLQSKPSRYFPSLHNNYIDLMITQARTGGRGGRGGTKTMLELSSEIIGSLPPYCFPNGARVYENKPLDHPKIHSFALREGGYCGVALTFHRMADARQFWDAWCCNHPMDVSGLSTPTSASFDEESLSVSSLARNKSSSSSSSSHQFTQFV